MAAAENDNAFALSLQERNLKLELPDDFLDPLLHALDAVIYLYFAALYICDQLSLLLILRLANQMVHIRSPSVAQLPPTILVSMVCVVTHLLHSREVGKRAYGGILIDFVGEPQPPKTSLLILDVTVFVLQLVMLVVGHEKQQLASGGVPATEESQTTQDLDSEEAGRLRSHAQDEAVETDEGIEMQSLLPNGAGEERSAHQKRSNPGGQDDDVIILDMKKGLKALMRRPPAVSTATESPTARLSLTAVLTRVAAARARAA